MSLYNNYLSFGSKHLEQINLPLVRRLVDLGLDYLYLLSRSQVHDINTGAIVYVIRLPMIAMYSGKLVVPF